MKRYIVAVDNLEEEQELKFKEFIDKQGLGWWHWIDNVWLIVDFKNQISSTQIREQLKIIAGDSYSLVMEVNNTNWAGWGPSTKNKNMFDWLKNTWTK